MVSQVLFCWKGLKKIETGMDMLLGKRLFAYFFFPPDIVERIQGCQKHSRCASANAGLS